MKHLERALDGQNNFWKYVVNFITSFIGANIIGSIPLIAVITYKKASSKGSLQPNPSNFMDFNAYGVSANLWLILIILPFIACIISNILLTKSLHKRTFSETVNGTNTIRWKRAFTGFGFWIALTALYFAIDYAIQPQNYVFQLDISTFLPLILISCLLIPFQTTFEEIMFRGYLGQGIGAWTKNRWLVIIIPGVLFGLMHIANPEVKEYGFWLTIPQYVMFGLFFGLITVLDDGIELAMGVHAANNIFASIMITNKASVLQTPAAFNQLNIDPLKETYVLLGMGILLVIALNFVYKWDFKILNKKIE